MTTSEEPCGLSNREIDCLIAKRLFNRTLHGLAKCAPDWETGEMMVRLIQVGPLGSRESMDNVMLSKHYDTNSLLDDPYPSEHMVNHVYSGDLDVVTYHTADIRSAFDVVNKMKELGWHYLVNWLPSKSKHHCCFTHEKSPTPIYNITHNVLKNACDLIAAHSYETSLERAICVAALKAVATRIA